MSVLLDTNNRYIPYIQQPPHSAYDITHVVVCVAIIFYNIL